MRLGESQNAHTEPRRLVRSQGSSRDPLTSSRGSLMTHLHGTDHALGPLMLMASLP